MKSRIIEICELGQPQSIIHRENEPITELIKTDSLIEELNEQLLLYNVVGQSEQYCDCGWFEKGEKKELNSYLVCKHCTKFL